MYINKSMQMLGCRLLFWTALVCAIFLPLVVHAEVNNLPFAAPANGCQLSAQQCLVPGCACSRCKPHGGHGHGVMSRRGCRAISLVYLPSIGADEPLHHSSPNDATLSVALPKITTADIFRPPQS
jgi:hypothetical protein